MKKNIQLPIFLLLAGLVIFASCEKTTPDPESQATLFADPANCFMVNAPGFYTFKTVKGKTTESVGDIATASVLWESFGTDAQPKVGDIITEAYYKEGRIYFSTPDVLKDGNAVIAVKDASNKILWSWHIWVCNGWDPKATAQTYYKKAGTTTFGAVMDRNLGATSASANDVRSMGLMYQWGRKDPFLGNDGVSEHKAAASTLIWPDPVLKTAETGTIDFAIAHPTAFIYPGQNAKESINGDWYFMEEDKVTDNTRWNEKKDLYDPCPAGWTLPRAHVSDNDDGLWYNAMGMDFTAIDDFDLSSSGANYSGILGDAASIYYPFTGHYAWEDGRLHPIGLVAIWSSDFLTDNDVVAGLPFSSYISVPTDQLVIYSYQCSNRAQGFPTRCVAVK